MPDLPAALLAPSESGDESPRSGDERRNEVYGEALAAQWFVRIAAAVIGALVQLCIIVSHAGHGDASRLATSTAMYVAFVLLVVMLVRRRGTASPAMVTGALLGDLTFIFVSTAISTSPAHYERALLGAMVVIHIANFYFGRRQAWRVIGLAFAGYLGLILWATLRDLPIDRVEELWTLGIGAVGTLLIVAQAANVRQRLRAIVTLFERAEEGDFTHTYDEVGDQRYDAITRVGQAYNRVRIQLASMVLTDPLTGCLNRRGFEQALAREISRASRTGTELALLVLDLDHFKRVNDRYGHPGGDEVLRTTGRLLLETARVGDTVARVGGEEFAVLLPATGDEGALHLASLLCGFVRSHAVVLALDARPIHVTTSIGVATAAPRNSRDSSGDGALLARRADIALYAAKRAGRDRARAWAPELDTLPQDGVPHHDEMIAPLGLA